MGEQYSATEYNRVRATVRSIVAENLHDVPASLDTILFRDISQTFMMFVNFSDRV